MPRTPNTHHVRLDDGRVVLYSYQTPVAVAFPDGRVVAHNHRYSVTTSRHVSQFAKGHTLDRVTSDVFAAFIAPLQMGDMHYV